MADERVVSDIVTKFLLDTCRLHPQVTRHGLEAVVDCVNVAISPVHNDALVERIPLLTGSAAEFYIEPMLPYVNDIDVMHHFSTMLAIPRGHPPPTQLPDEFSNYVNVWEIVDSRQFPGYVYLKLCYLLTERSDDGKYSCSLSDSQPYLSHYVGGRNKPTQGPAWRVRSYNPAVPLPIDRVRCVRCLSWPS